MSVFWSPVPVYASKASPPTIGPRRYAQRCCAISLLRHTNPATSPRVAKTAVDAPTERCAESSKIVFRTLPAAAAITTVSCDIQDNTVEPQDVFTRVYNNDNFDDSFVPISIAQTADSGYLVLGGREVTDTQFLVPYLIKVDSKGDFQWEQTPSENYANPLSGLTISGNSYQFFCMDNLNLGTYLIQEEDVSGSFKEVGY